MSEENKKEEFSVEEALKKLEEINRLLENPNTSLKESMELYKEGVILADKCKESLEGVEKEIKILEGTDN